MRGLLTAISGAGGYGYQDGDWRKHNVIVKDLVDSPWPVQYEFYGRPVALVYYLVNADGALVAQDDHPPVSRAVSTSLWQPGLTLCLISFGSIWPRSDPALIGFCWVCMIP